MSRRTAATDTAVAAVTADTVVDDELPVAMHWRTGEPPRADASTVIGMHTPAAAIAASTFVVICVLISAHNSGGVRNWWLFGAVLLLIAVALANLLVASGDPMNALATTTVCAVVLLVPALTLLAVDVMAAGYGVAMGGCATALAFLCVRGRVLAAWLSYLLHGLVLALSAIALGHDPVPWLTVMLPNTAVLLMATLFAAIVRPAAREIYALRAQTASAVAEEAAAQAALDERDDQLRRLDTQARPLLERIAGGAELTDDELARCTLVESRLRDGIRARALDVPEVVEAVWAARRRGVVVRLLDDSGGTPADGDEPADGAGQRAWQRLHSAVAAEVAQCEPGSAITVRVYPRQRANLASIVVAGPQTMTHTIFGPDGKVSTGGN